MNAISWIYRLSGRWFWKIALVLIVSGCATNKINWMERVGTYTYDQSVMDYGPPDKQAKLQDGTIVAEWMTRRGYSYAYPAFGYGYYPYWYGAPFPSYVDTPDSYLRLTFGPDGKLKAGKNFTK